MRRALITALIIIRVSLSSVELPAQGINEYMAGKAFEKLQYSDAIKYYSEALYKFRGEEKHKNELLFRLGTCYTMVNDPAGAEKIFRALSETEFAGSAPQVSLFLARALLNQGKYEDGLLFFSRYLDLVPGDPIALAGKASCELGLKNLPDDTRWKVQNGGDLNSPADDFAAAYLSSLGDSIIFTSNRTGSSDDIPDGWTGKRLSDIYFAKRQANGSWNVILTRDSIRKINSASNEGTPVFSSATGRLFFTRCPESDSGLVFCEILEAEKAGNDWKNIRRVYSDNQGNAGQPAVSDDGKVLIFVSDRPGGQGAKDLWKSTRKSIDDSFGLPENMGAAINTPGNDMFPSIVGDSLLFFASDGRAGLGGLDIYCTTTESRKNVYVKHLPSPVNSFSDDYGIIFNISGKQGLMTSRRKGGKGSDDIWLFERVKYKVSITGNVLEEGTSLPLNANVTLVRADRDSIRAFTDKNGYFGFPYDKIMAPGSYSVQIMSDKHQGRTFNIITADPLQDTAYVVNAWLKPLQKEYPSLPDIRFAFDRSDLSSQYRDSLKSIAGILMKIPEANILISAHTDSRGPANYNESLSARRASTISRFLVASGIDKGRIINRPVGERDPKKLEKDLIINNFTFNGGTTLSDDFIETLKDPSKKEAAHSLNRRTEIIITGKSE